MSDRVRIIRLSDTGDSRGSNFTAPQSCLDFLGSVKDVYIATVRPGAIRGNHYHHDRREVLCVLYADQWSLHWDSGAGTEIRSEAFSGTGTILVEIEPLASHAVRNDGGADVRLIALSNVVYDARQPDSYGRSVV